MAPDVASLCRPAGNLTFFIFFLIVTHVPYCVIPCMASSSCTHYASGVCHSPCTVSIYTLGCYREKATLSPPSPPRRMLAPLSLPKVEVLPRNDRFTTTGVTVRIDFTENHATVQQQQVLRGTNCAYHNAEWPLPWTEDASMGMCGMGEPAR